MKVIALTLTALCLVAAAQAQFDYQLMCTREEIGIRWPNYHSNDEYYVCHRVGGRPIKLSCRSGELFTFVLQSCTSPSQFIPPPPMNILPTSAPSPGYHPVDEHEIVLHPSLELPKPAYPMQPAPPILTLPSANQPPMAIDEHPPTWQMPMPEPPYITDFEETHPEEVEEVEEEPVKPTKPVKPGKPMPHLPIKGQQPPLPPTPAPTPPVMQQNQPPKKIPQLPNKKQPVEQATTPKKQPPKPSGARKPMPPKPVKA